jgi:fructokinase
MITVAGEALIDIVIGASGSITALPGGAPFNVARTIARLGGTCQFLGKLSDDTFGEQLQASLQRDGVKIAVAIVTSAPDHRGQHQLEPHVGEIEVAG